MVVGRALGAQVDGQVAGSHHLEAAGFELI